MRHLFGKIDSIRFLVRPAYHTLTWFGKAASERRNLAFYKLSIWVCQHFGSLAYTIDLYVLHTHTQILRTLKSS